MSQRHRAEAAELPPTEELRAHARGERHRIKGELHVLSSSVGRGVEADDADEPGAAWRPLHRRDPQRARTKAAKAKRRRHWKLKSWKRRTTLRRQKAAQLRVVADEG